MIQSDTFTTSDGCGIAYSVTGPSRPALQRVVLIHSLGLDRSIWNDVMPRLPTRMSSSMTAAVMAARVGARKLSRRTSLRAIWRNCSTMLDGRMRLLQAARWVDASRWHSQVSILRERALSR
jgi:hypothetical protein